MQRTMKRGFLHKIIKTKVGLKIFDVREATAIIALLENLSRAVLVCLWVRL